jgi:hypothetical protein
VLIDDEKAPVPAAYCAPGSRAVAELVLAVKGEAVTGVTEHPYLAGWDGILLVSPQALLEIAPLPLLTVPVWGYFGASREQAATPSL